MSIIHFLRLAKRQLADDVNVNGTDLTEAHSMVNFNDGDGTARNKVMLAVEIPLIVLAISTVGLRIWSRSAVKRKIAVDDILIILGLCCAFGRTVISCMSADDGWGFDIDGPNHDFEIPYYQHIFERRIAYIFAVTFTRFSILAYYLRIFPPGLVSLRRSCWILLILALAQFIEVSTVLLVFCKSIPKLWTQDYLSFSGSRCFSSSTYSYSAAIGDSVVDCLIFALPIPYVWSLSKLKVRQRIGLVVIFALGFIVCVVALLQIPFIKRRETHATYFGGAINMLIAVQLSLAIVAASLPDIRALTARSFPNFSLLHHRSPVTHAQNDARARGDLDLEYGRRNNNDTTPLSLGIDGRGNTFRKPDWLRNSLPASLMSTRVTQVTQNEISRTNTGESVFPGHLSTPGTNLGRTTNVPRRGSRRPTLADVPPLPEHSEKSEGSNG